MAWATCNISPRGIQGDLPWQSKISAMFCQVCYSKYENNIWGIMFHELFRFNVLTHKQISHSMDIFVCDIDVSGFLQNFQWENVSRWLTLFLFMQKHQILWLFYKTNKTNCGVKGTNKNDVMRQAGFRCDSYSSKTTPLNMCKINTTFLSLFGKCVVQVRN